MSQQKSVEYRFSTSCSF